MRSCLFFDAHDQFLDDGELVGVVDVRKRFRHLVADWIAEMDCGEPSPIADPPVQIDSRPETEYNGQTMLPGVLRSTDGCRMSGYLEVLAGLDRPALLGLGGRRQPSLDEERYLVLGASSAGRLLVVSHTERPPGTRIISARPATRNERSHYEQGI